MKRKSLLFLLLMAMFAPLAMNGQQSLPYSYGFENYDLAADGWTTANPYSSNTSEFGIAAAAKHNGNYGFRFSSYSRNTNGYDQYLFSPELDGARGVILSFWYAASSTSGTELFKVGYSTTNTNISSFTWGNEISTYNTSWAQSEEFMFPAGTKYVAIWYYSNYQYRLFVDDFSFTAVPSCVRPTLSDEVILGMENASVQWTENGTATNWELQYSTNADFSGATTINRNGIPAYNISDLSAATTYYARVRANCGGGDYSDWSNVISFTTWACENATAVEYNLTDSYGDGWNGNAIRIFDGCGDLVETLTIASGSSNSGTLSLCGDYYQFVWHTGSYANETSFTLTVNGTAIYSQQSGSNLTDGQVLHTIGIQPPVKPTALTAGTPGANEVQLSWTENGTATTWQICINDEENNLVVANSNPFTLTGLNALTAYTVKVRSTNGTNASCWSNVVSFTTDSSCPTPTNLTATNVMPTSATLNWEGDAESYNVRYRKVIGESQVFFDGFENGIGNWTTVANSYSSTATNWRQFNAENFVDDDGNPTMFNHTGSYVAMSRSYGGSSVGEQTVDNWLISPQVTLDGVLKYWVINDDGADYVEHYSIYVSTSGTSTGNFTLLYEPNSSSTAWTEHTVDLSSFNGATGYIAFRHNDTGKDLLLIDDVSINAVQYSAWTTESVGSNSFNITGLDPESTYQVQVQANCGTDGLSGWSASATFTTPDGCAVPTGLTAEVTGNTAELSWAGYADTYDIQYHEVDPTAPATIILNVPSDIWNDGSGYQMLLDADATAYGDVFTATGGWTATDYSAFEYLIPTEAECSADATHFVIENSVSIQIPAGTYDWCIVNPSPGDKIYIAAQNGNVGGRQDDYVFEPGMTYEFIPSIYGTNDGIDVTITDNNTWTLVEGVTNPYLLENLSSQTTYEFQVQGADCSNWSASATFTTGEFYVKHIDNWSSAGYYLISSPIATPANSTVPAQVANMITDPVNGSNTYDLYRFDQAEELEWQNYRYNNLANAFDLEFGKGYLYGNTSSSNGVDLVFTGTAYSGDGVVTLTKVADEDLIPGLDFPDWNLVGNPFPVNAYFADDRDFYTMNKRGTEIILVGDGSDARHIERMEGVFVIAETNGETVTFTTTKPNNNGKSVTLNLSNGNNIIDRAIVRFGQGRQLPKFQLNRNSTKLYIPQDGQDYAVVCSEEMGAMPVSFKAEDNDTYTMNFSCTNVGFAYLHLIDNKTGNDVDLLQTPNYSFEAKTTDYESRFKLVFATGDNSNDDNFAFFSNGSFVINNDGTAELQVIDLMGRILSSETINGCTNVNVNAAPGVYMLRLINGTDVKVQKVVVK